MFPHDFEIAADPVIQIAQDKLRYVLRIPEIVIADLVHHEMCRCLVGSKVIFAVIWHVDLHATVPIHVPIALIRKCQELTHECGVEIMGKDRVALGSADIAAIAANDGSIRSKETRKVNS